jgi:hypothetical protein
MFVPAPGGTGGSQHHYTFAQKIFRIGEEGSLGIAMWGLGNLIMLSYRTLIARFADQLPNQPPKFPQELADRWASYFWSEYTSNLGPVYQRAQVLVGQPTRTPEENRELLSLVQTFSGGFCIGGWLPPDRTPFAYEILYDPTRTACGPNRHLELGSTNFWGCPNLIMRLINGIDESLFSDIVASGKWTGTPQELANLVMPHRLSQPFDLPIREAIDWVYTSVYTTIHAMKFSHLAPVCGGPVEVAVITTDRPFRWVRHKRLDAAIASKESADGR